MRISESGEPVILAHWVIGGKLRNLMTLTLFSGETYTAILQRSVPKMSALYPEA
jgi:hypothetical protein